MLRLDRRTLAFILTAGLVLGSATVHAQTIIYVDDDAPPGGDGTTWARAYGSPYDALAAAESGDQIWVAAGRYVGSFTLTLGVELYGGFAGTEAELTQRDWKANPTILDGDASGSVVTSPSGATATIRIDGFTITNGNGSGVYLPSSSPTIVNNTITGNSGHGLTLVRSSPTIANNTIAANSANVGGGGLYLRDDSSPAIVNNTIMGNSAHGCGGGLLLSSSSPTIANNTITGNSADDRGGGLYLLNSSPTIVSNAITGNIAHYGGGLYLDTSSSPTIADNTIAANSAGEGGGLYLNLSSPTIVNTTTAGNSVADDSGELYLSSYSATIANTIIAFNSSGIYRGDTSDIPALRYNCVFGNTGYDYSGLTDPTGTDGNILAEPLFVQIPDPGPDGLWGTPDDDFGDLQLRSGSRCVDAGDNAAVPEDTLDLDGSGQVNLLDFGVFQVTFAGE